MNWWNVFLLVCMPSEAMKYGIYIYVTCKKEARRTSSHQWKVTFKLLPNMHCTIHSKFLSRKYMSKQNDRLALSSLREKHKCERRSRSFSFAMIIGTYFHSSFYFPRLLLLTLFPQIVTTNSINLWSFWQTSTAVVSIIFSWFVIP